MRLSSDGPEVWEIYEKLTGYAIGHFPAHTGSNFHGVGAAIRISFSRLCDIFKSHPPKSSLKG